MPKPAEYKTLTERIDAIYKRINTLAMKPNRARHNATIAKLTLQGRQLIAERERLFDQWQRVKR